MQGSHTRATARRVGALMVGVVAAVGLVFGGAGTAGAAHRVRPVIDGISVSSHTVPAGGLLLIGVQAHYAVPEEFAVTFYVDLAKGDIPAETCDTGSGPDNGDNPSCEYDNTFMDPTSTVGLLHVAPNATGRFRVTICAETLTFGGGPLKGDTCRVREFRIR